MDIHFAHMSNISQFSRLFMLLQSLILAGSSDSVPLIKGLCSYHTAVRLQLRAGYSERDLSERQQQIGCRACLALSLKFQRAMWFWSSALRHDMTPKKQKNETCRLFFFFTVSYFKGPQNQLLHMTNHCYTTYTV